MMKPNIVLFVCDDLRWDALSGMGHPIVQTPNLDQMMADGTTFTRCNMGGGSSGAVCMPSRAMLHTGRSQFRIQDEGQEIPPEHLTIGEFLQEQGYDSFHTGKWHNERSCFNRCFNDGDEIFLGGMGDQWNMPLYHYDPSGKYDARTPYVLDPFKEKQIRYRDGDHTGNGTHATEVFVNTAKEYLSSRSDTEKPFFLSVALTAPHDPRNAPKQFHDMYDPDEIPLPENFLAQHPHDTGDLRERDESLATIPRQPAEVREHVADYYAMISHLDHEFGQLLDSLRESGMEDNTVVIFTADHGLAVGQHGLMGKQNLYDHSIRIPFIMTGPGIQKGLRIDELVCHYDLFATLCDMLHVQGPDGLDSRSMLPVMQGNPGREELYLAYTDRIRGLYKDGLKLIEYATGEYRATQLFNILEDPDECLDRSRDPHYSDSLKSMRSRMIALGKESLDVEHRLGKAFWNRYL